MNLSAPDVHQTLEYRTDKTIVRMIPIGLLAIFLGLLIAVLVDAGAKRDFTALDIVGPIVCAAIMPALVS